MGVGLKGDILNIDNINLPIMYKITTAVKNKTFMDLLLKKDINKSR